MTMSVLLCCSSTRSFNSLCNTTRASLHLTAFQSQKASFPISPDWQTCQNNPRLLYTGLAKQWVSVTDEKYLNHVLSRSNSVFLNLHLLLVTSLHFNPREQS